MMPYLNRVVVSLDKLINVLLGGKENETICARCWRKRKQPMYKVLCKIIDALMGKNHCKNSSKK
jgi:hypothetical protein